MLFADVLGYCLSSPTKRHRLCLDIALTYGADANNTLESTIPTLVTACESAIELEKMCLMLLEKGADPNAINKVKVNAACLWRKQFLFWLIFAFAYVTVFFFLNLRQQTRRLCLIEKNVLTALKMAVPMPLLMKSYFFFLAGNW